MFEQNMCNMLTRFIFIYTLLLLNNICFGQQLNLEDIWLKGAYTAKAEGGWHWLNDGKHYVDLISLEKGKQAIVKFEIISGKPVDTLLFPSQLIPKDSLLPIKIISFEISDDLKKIVLQTEVEPIYRHSTIEKNYIYFRETNKLELLSTKGKQRYVSFSPDGQKVAYVIDNNMYYADLVADEITEVMISNDGKKNSIINGATDWVYEEEFGINKAYQWSPDNKNIAYYRFDESKVKEFSISFYKSNNYPSLETYKYPKAGEDNSAVTIQVYNLESQKNIYTYKPAEDAQQYYIPSLKWGKIANHLYLQKLNRLQNDLELIVCNITTGKHRLVLHENSNTYIDVNSKGESPVFVDFNESFLWLSEMEGFNEIYLYNTSGIKLNKVSKSGFDVVKFYGYNETNKTVYFQSVGSKPYLKELVSANIDGKLSVLLGDTLNSYGAEFDLSLNHLIVSKSALNRPTLYHQYSIIENNFTKIKELENNDDLQLKLNNLDITDNELGATFFNFTTPDSVVLYGYMIKPHKIKKKKKYPIFMYCYGGPGNSLVENRFGGGNFMYFQYLASLGYGVVCVDNRGTGNRGVKFKNCTYLNLGEIETNDQISAAKYLGGLGWVDSTRISMFGWSYGGFMAANCITKGAKTFKCAISVAPVTNWKYYDNIYTERYMSTPQLNPVGYENSSCIKYTGLYKGKLLLIHGTGDDNVHFQNSLEFSNSLIKENKQFEQFFYPNRNHGIGGGVTRLNLYQKMTNFIIQNL
jgi:dipeptidyl-peptidase-4